MAKAFPLTLHKTGHYCKKIHGRMYYFGKDKTEALRQYYAQATTLHTAAPASDPRPGNPSVTIEMLANAYLDHQASRRKGGEITATRYLACEYRLRMFVKFLGPTKLVEEISAYDLAHYRDSLLARSLCPSTINNYLKVVKALFHWACALHLVRRDLELNVLKTTKEKRQQRQIFTSEQIEDLLAAASPRMRAMIYLGINCGFGPTDCARLRWSHLDFAAGRVNYPRPKTGVSRDLALWPDTIAALRQVPVQGEFVFYTKIGTTYDCDSGHSSPITEYFRACLHRAGVVADKGAGFYTLRRTGATIIAQTGDVFAVQAFLAHASLQEATTYVQTYKLTTQTDKAIVHLVQWLKRRSATTANGPVRLAS